MLNTSTAALAPNRTESKAFLKLIFDPIASAFPHSQIEIAFSGPLTGDSRMPPNKARLFPVSDVARAAKFAEKKNQQGSNVYYGVNPRRPAADASKRANNNDIIAANFQFADADDAEAANAILDAKPDLLVQTGFTPELRLHGYWQWYDPIQDLGEWQANQKQIQQSLGTDKVSDPARIMRLPGTVNYPNEAKQLRGYVPEVVTWLGM